MADSTIPTYTLNNETTLPAIGFGTYPLKGDEGVAAIGSALDIGYRLLDTAVNYENETEVGEALRRSGLPRDEVQVTSKLPGRHHAYDEADRLGSWFRSNGSAWTTSTCTSSTGRTRASTSTSRPGEPSSISRRRDCCVRSGSPTSPRPTSARIIDDTGVTPAVNQIELHPRFPQEEMRRVHERLGIRTEAWSPLGKTVAPLDEPAVTGPAERLGVTAGQVILRWHVQIGSLPIPKSGNPERQRQNLDVFGFELTDDEVAGISALAETEGRRFGGDPDHHEEM